MSSRPGRLLAASILATATASAAATLELTAIDLARVDPAVRRQLETERRQLDEQVRAGASEEEVAVGLLDLGRLYLAYDYVLHGTEALEKARARRPDHFETVYLLAYAHDRQGHRAEAIAAFERSVELDPTSAVARLRLGHLLLDERRTGEAAELYRQAESADPTCLGAIYGQGEIARRAGDDAEAEKHFRRALERSPEAAQLRYALGLTLRRLGRVEEAQAQLQQAQWETLTFGGWLGCADPWVQRLLDSTTGAPAHLLRGARAQVRGDAAGEVREYSQAVVANPGDAVARSNLASALYRQDDLYGAAEHYQEAVRLDPDNAAYLYDLGLIRQRLGAHEEAEALFRRAAELNPRFKEAHLKIATLEAQRGNFEAVVDHCRRVTEVDPLNRQARTQMGAALLRLGRQEEAMEQVGELLDIDPPTDPVERLRMASQVAMAGDLDRARRHFAEIARIADDPKVRAVALSREGQVHLQKGEIAPAIERLEAALELDPDLQEARQALGFARQRSQG